jgi:guanylate kinase
MMPDVAYKFVILTGPSCIGKSPLRRAFFRHHPDVAANFLPLTLYTSRAPRPGEEEGKHYYFRSRDEIESLKDENGFVVEEVRGDLQAVNLELILMNLDQGKNLIYEGNPFIAKRLVEFVTELNLNVVSIFISPLSRNEVEKFLKHHTTNQLRDVLTEYMQQKLLAREATYKPQLGLSDLNDLHLRAASAFDELTMAPEFDIVLPNHDGEDSNHWKLFGFPIGDAGELLAEFTKIIQGAESEKAEYWAKFPVMT